MALAVLAVVVLIPWPDPWKDTNHTKTDDRKDTIDVAVAFSPSPRPVDQSVLVVLTVGPKTSTDHTNESPWSKTFPVDKGTVVTVVAQQISPGVLSCRIKVNGQQVSHDLGEGKLQVACTTGK